MLLVPIVLPVLSMSNQSITRKFIYVPPPLGNGRPLLVFRHLLDTRTSLCKTITFLTKSDSSHPTEPQCSYDPVEGLPLAPDIDPLEKIKDLEDQIGMDYYYFSYI
jgi:hypothetical protein